MGAYPSVLISLTTTNWEMTHNFFISYFYWSITAVNMHSEAADFRGLTGLPSVMSTP